MSSTDQFDWVEFYRELAGRLLQYKENRQELTAKVYQIYEFSGVNMPTLEKDNQLADIDPFTVFGLFNKSSMKESNRGKILSAVAEIFHVSAPVPTSFASIPVLNNQNATFYYFLPDRGKDDIDDLWALFGSALAYADDPTPDHQAVLSEYFDLAINKKGNGNSKITMGMYWIAPDTFLNLDQRNTWYIYESGKVPSEFVKTLPEVKAKIPAETYFEIVEKMHAWLQSGDSPLRDFKELSFEAWRYSNEINEENRAAGTGSKRETKGAALADAGVDTVHYWLYAPGESACLWEPFYQKGIMALGWDEVGDLKSFSSKEEIRQSLKAELGGSSSYKNTAHALWQFSCEMKPGDVVFAKKGRAEILGRGVIESDYLYDPEIDKEHPHTRKVRWTHKGSWHSDETLAMKTLTDLTSYTDTVERLKALFKSNDDTAEDFEDGPEIVYPSYDAGDFLEEVYMDQESYNTLAALVRNKKNVILQGAPGVGKTYAAKRLAYSMMGVKDPNRVKMVQFHQSYSYEDFIMGFRPSEKGFELKRGAFYNFCKEAEIDSENEYFFIIDEINRGNLSKIFGELFMLIESDKRGVELELLYSDEKFSMPENVYLIGMMNTADRSLAMMDYALRRRFAFFEMKPGFDTEGFRKYRMGLGSDKFDRLISCVENLNAVIAADESLGEGFCIGHSYFCNLKKATDRELSGIVEFELIPLLKEYWFDEPIKVKDWTNSLRSAVR